MSDSYVRGEPATEVLDLYDVLPERAEVAREPGRSTEDDPVTSMIKGTGRNLMVIIGMFAVSLAAFVACTTLFSLGVGLLVLVVGLFILVGCRSPARACRPCSAIPGASPKSRSTPCSAPSC